MGKLNFNLGGGSGNGVILTHGGIRVLDCMFAGEDLTSTAVALWLTHATGGKHAKIIDCDFLGHVSYMKVLLIDRFARSNFERLRFHNCLAAIQMVGAESDHNLFHLLDVGENALGFDIDAGNEQILSEIAFHHNAVNIDDEVGNHVFFNMRGAFPITIEPDNLTGITVSTGGAGAWGGDTELRGAAASTMPFRVVGINMEPSTSEWYQLRLSADGGITFFDVIQFDARKREGLAALSGTEFIFNAGTRISASARSVSGGGNVKVWLELQEI